MIDPVAFSLFGIDVKWYGILIATGALLAVLLCMRREKRYELPKDTSINLVLWAVPLALICARAYYVIFTWDYYRVHPDHILRLRDGGIAIYGAILGGMLGALLYAKRAKLSFLTLADLVAPGLALGQAIGRWGNFVNQEAYGEMITNPAWQFFPVAVYIERQQAYFQATFFYESAWCFIIVLILLILEKRGIFRRRGDCFFTYTLLYALERSVVEGMRSDSLYWGPFRVSQLLSIAVGLAVVVYFITRRIRKKA
ncbi:MAG: prolipoprotein diacylglyceryl transferase [Clostridiales bacterium]|nr:prolipoprotein diacylglyceryl transferase [Clostridiales bacterium]